MSLDASDCTPSVYFYIGANDSDEEDEGFENDCEPVSASCIPLLTQIWNDISTWEEGHDPPLELAIKILRILQGLKMTPQESKQTLASCNAYLNRRVSKVSAALQEYKEHICTQVFSILEEKEQHDLSELKEEIQQIKKQIQHAKLLSHQKDRYIRKKRSLLRDIKEALVGSHQLRAQNLDLETENLHIISPEKQLEQRAPSEEEQEEEEEESTVNCLDFCKLSRRK